MTYSYYPEKMNTDAKDRMRFELADTDVGRDNISAALSDEEINAVLERYPDDFRMAKFKLVEHLVFKYGQDVDNSVGPVSFTFSHRMDFWKNLYDDMKKDMAQGAVGSLKPYGGEVERKENYFYVGMMHNPGGGRRRGKR